MDLDKVLPTIISQFVSVDGCLVDYEKLKKRAPWAEFLKEKKVRVADNGILKRNEEEKRCFFINLYNFLCIYGVCIEKILPLAVTKVTNFFDQELCLLGELALSLDDILHGILRCNKPHPASNSPYFSDKSSKLALSLKTMDPRVLFALNSCDRSSSPLRFFSAHRLDSDLTEASSDFLQPRVACSVPGRSVVIPRVFLWYRKDFPGGHDVGSVRWIARFLPQTESAQLIALMDELECIGGVRIVHDSYDWSLNNLSGTS